MRIIVHSSRIFINIRSICNGLCVYVCVCVCVCARARVCTNTRPEVCACVHALTFSRSRPFLTELTRPEILFAMVHVPARRNSSFLPDE